LYRGTVKVNGLDLKIPIATGKDCDATKN